MNCDEKLEKFCASDVRWSTSPRSEALPSVVRPCFSAKLSRLPCGIGCEVVADRVPMRSCEALRIRDPLGISTRDLPEGWLNEAEEELGVAAVVVESAQLTLSEESEEGSEREEGSGARVGARCSRGEDKESCGWRRASFSRLRAWSWC